MLPFLLVGDGVPVLAGQGEGGELIGFDLVNERLLSFELEDVIGAVSIDPAAVFYGLDLSWARAPRMAAENPVRPLPRFAPRGYKFLPLPKGGVTGFPTRRLQLHRREVPSVETIRLSTVFAGMTIGVSIKQAEKAFGCIADIFVGRGRRFAPLGTILDCIYSLGYHRIRKALYEESAGWAPIVQDAIRNGLRDRELRRYLLLQTDVPTGLSIAKTSFTLMLLGHDVVCLDVRILQCMFGKRADEMAGKWKVPTDRSIKLYERVEDAFLKGNRFYNPRNPLGKARAQWMSWESVGSGKPRRTWCRHPTVETERHQVWLDVVQDGS